MSEDLGDFAGEFAADARIRLVTAARGVRGVEGGGRGVKGEGRGERGVFGLSAEERDRKLGLLAVADVNRGAPLNPRRFPSSPIEAWSEDRREGEGTSLPSDLWSGSSKDGQSFGELRAGAGDM